MKHPTILQLNLYADKALSGELHDQVRGHLAQCADCAAQVKQLKQEALFIRRALVTSPVPVPAFHPPLQMRDLLRGLGILAGFAWILAWVWQTLISADMKTLAEWFSPSALSGSIALSIETVFFVSEEGSKMLTLLYTIALSVFVLGMLLWWSWHHPRLRTAFSMVCCVLLAGPAFIEPASAVEIRRGDRGDSMTVPAGEVIDDSLVMAGQTIRVDGDVRGDLVAAGQRVIVSGDIDGNLVVFAQNVTVRGIVHGSLLGFAQSVELEGEVQGSMLGFSESTRFTGASLLRDYWGYTGRVNQDESSSIGGNATFFTGNATFDGSVGRDMTGFAERIEISGSVGDDIDAWIRTLSVFDSALIEGDLNYRAREEQGLQLSPGATINGNVNYDNSFYENFSRPNRYLTVRYYLHQLLRLGAAFLAGLCLFSLAPAMRQVSLGGGMEGLKAAGLGLLALVSAPIIALILAVTIIGIPLGVVMLFSWAIVWYFAKIMMAWLIGNALLNSREDASFPLRLFVGLLAVIIIVNLPMIGGVLSAVMTWTGAGLLIIKGYQYSDRNKQVTV